MGGGVEVDRVGDIFWILLLRTRRDLRNGEIGKILHDSKAHINGELK